MSDGRTSPARNMTGPEIALIVARLQPAVEGARVSRIDQPDDWSIVLDLRRAEHRLRLLLSADPRFSRIHLLSYRPRTQTQPGALLQVMRAHVTGAKLTGIAKVEGDRVVILTLQQRSELMIPQSYRLVAELIGLHANLIFLDPSDRVLAALRPVTTARRRLRPGQPYEPLPPAPAPSTPPTVRFPRNAQLAELSDAVESHFAGLLQRRETEERRARLLAVLHARETWLQRSIQEQSLALAEARERERIRQFGELLKLKMHEIERGQAGVRVINYFEPDQPEVEIPLDPSRTPQENLEAYFKRYKKLEAAEEHLAEAIENLQEELAEVRQLQERLSQEPESGLLDDVEARMKELDIFPPPEQPRPAAEAPAGPRSFTSANDMEILVARNQRQNEQLTFRIARGNDIWMHVADWPGPHVIIRRGRNQEVPHATILDAAHLAVHFSKIRGASVADVVYTERKHVQKAKGGRTGAVNYASPRKLAVRIQPERLARLLDH